MPYVITTKHFTPTDQQPGLATRQAVATLDEAREAAKRIVEDADYPTGEEAQAAMAGDAARCEVLAEPGGAVVLPEGTVIEVEQVGLNDLRIGTDTLRMTPAELVAAYNAAQG